MPRPDPDRRLVPTDPAQRAALEAQADAIVFGATSSVTKQSDKADILTPWKEKWRRGKEVYVRSGTPDQSVRKGLYIRKANKRQWWLNSVDPVHSGVLRSSSRRLRGTGIHEADPVTHFPASYGTHLYEWRVSDGKQWPVKVRWTSPRIESGSGKG